MLIFDIETDGKDPERVSRLWCLCTLDTATGEELRFDWRRIPKALDRLATADRLAGHNVLAYDLPVLRRLYGFEAPGEAPIDTLVLSRLIANGLSDDQGGDEFGRHALEAWGQRLGCPKGDWSDFSRFAPEMIDYCLQDCRVVRQLLDHLRQQQPAGRACMLELRYEAYLREIEAHGFTFDGERCGVLASRLDRRLASLQAKIDRYFPPQEITGSRPAWFSYEPAGAALFNQTGNVPRFTAKAQAEAWRKQERLRPRDVRLVEGPPAVKRVPFNPGSNPAVIRGLQSLGWVAERETETGAAKVAEEDLWHADLPVAKLIAAWRGYQRLRGFCTQWLGAVRDGKLHPHFVGNRTVTNRSSGKRPNVQQIPSGKARQSGMRLFVPYGPRCRALFRPQPGWVLVGADLEGIEARLLGHYLAPFDGGEFGRITCSGADIHQSNADRIGITRSQAKSVLYGSLYGMGPRSLALKLGITYPQARAIIEAFTGGLPGFADLLDAIRLEWESSGRVELIDGRRLQCLSDHKLLNYKISGSAAVLFKVWILRAAEALRATSYRLLAVIHDEAQAECLPLDQEIVREALEQTAAEAGRALGFRVPIAAGAKAGRSWAETH